MFKRGGYQAGSARPLSSGRQQLTQTGQLLAMNPLAYLVAPLLLLPVAVAPPVVPGQPSDPALIEQPRPSPVANGPADSYPLSWLVEAWRSDSAEQVRIEQHIIIRISPAAPSTIDPRVAMFSESAPQPARTKIEERSIGKCLPIDGVAGLQVSSNNKLVLFMRDARVVSAGLDKGCSARDFYAGFYVARSADGLMCAGRDKLQARNGASCKLGKIKQLVEVGD